MSLEFILINYFVMLLLFFFGLFIQELSSLNNRTVFYGTRIPVGYEKSDKLTKLHKKYKTNFCISYLILLIIVAAVIYVSSDEMAVNFVLPASLSGMAVIAANYLIIYQKVQQIKKIENWQFDNNTVVVIDTNFRKSEANNLKLAVSPWWFTLPVAIMLLAFIVLSSRMAGQVNKGTYLLMFIQAMMNILFYAAYHWTKNAKQNLNGGSVDEVLFRSRRIRYYMTLSYLLTAIFLNIIFTIIGFSISGIIKPDILNSRATQLITLLIPVAIAIIAVLKIVKSQKRHNANTLSTGERLSMNRDDDKYYKFGVFYYNKCDPSLFVEKRIGFGFTFNFARPAAKVISGVVGVLIGSMLLGMIFYIPGLTNERQVDIDQNSFVVHGAWGQEISKEAIRKVSIENDLPKVLMKTNGAGINKKLYGWFKLQGYDRAALFVGDKTMPFVAIYLKDGGLVLINFADENKTTSLYSKIISTMNLEE